MATNKKGVMLSTRDYEGFRTDMIEMLKKKIPEYSDFSQSDAGIVLIELLAYQLDVLSYYNEKVGNEMYLETAQERESVARLCRMLGYTLREATPSRFEQVFEIIPQEDEDFTIPQGTMIQTIGDDLEPIVDFETVEPLVIPRGCTGLEKDENGRYLYTVDVLQGYSIDSEIVGSSNNAPNQTFILDYSPVIMDSVVISVDDGLGFETWTKVDSFIDSYSQSKHYLLTINDQGQAQITFGNGVSGAIPKSIEDGIMASYRVGGGTDGNVGINTIVKMPMQLSEIKRTFNPYAPIIIGRDREGVDEARIKAPSQLGRKWGAVTLKDYKAIALGVLGVARANATEGPTGTMLVNVYYYPDGTVTDNSIRHTLIDIYDEKKVVGTLVNIEKGHERPVHITANIKTLPMYKTSEVEEAVDSVIRTIMLPGKYDFGEAPENSDLVTDILSVDTVRGVEIQLENHTNLQPNEIIVLGEVTVNVRGGRN